MPEKEPTYLSTEKRFARQINERFNLWISIIDDSGVKLETKEKIKKILSNFKENAFTGRQNLCDSFYSTISQILTVTDRDNDKDRAKALFENIRDDIWALFKEVSE